MSSFLRASVRELDDPLAINPIYSHIQKGFVDIYPSFVRSCFTSCELTSVHSRLHILNVQFGDAIYFKTDNFGEHMDSSQQSSMKER